MEVEVTAAQIVVGLALVGPVALAAGAAFRRLARLDALSDPKARSPK